MTVGDCKQNDAPNDTILTHNGVPMTADDLARLDDGQELNDDNIDFYFQLLVTRAEKNKAANPSVYSFGTFLWQVISSNQPFDIHLARWTKNVNLSEYDFLLFPVNRNHHWSLVVVDQRSNVIEYFDPLKFADNGATDAVRDYLIEEHLHYVAELLPKTHWQIRNFDKFIRQNNSTDCGAYICAFAKWRTGGFTTTPTEMGGFRTRMKEEILNKSLE